MSTLVVDTIENIAGVPFVPPDSSSLAVAWCVFNGATLAVLNSYNISAITSEGGLTYKLFSTTSFPDNCAVIATQNTVYGYSACSGGKESDGSIVVYVSSSTLSLYPSTYIAVAVFG